MFQKFMSHQAKLSLNFFIDFTYESKQLKPYMQTNNKFREVFTNHLKILLESIKAYMKVACRYIYQTFPFSFW